MPIRSRSRFDPYKSFKFRVKWGGRYVAGVGSAGPLKPNIDPAKMYAIRRAPGLHKFPAIALKRGMVHDLAFALWVMGRDERARRTIIIEQHDDAAGKPRTYKVRSAWVSKYTTGAPTASEHALTIDELMLENEGIKREERKPRAERAAKRKRS